MKATIDAFLFCSGFATASVLLTGLSFFLMWATRRKP